MSQSALTRQQLEDELKTDGIPYPYPCNATAMNKLGCQYKHKNQYDKAMSWFRLSSVENCAAAQNNIGFLYEHGLGVPQDGLVAIEWYLKAAIQNLKTAWKNISFSFENGIGVPVDKYRAYEWYCHYRSHLNEFDVFTNEVIQLEQKDCGKSIKQLIIEAEDIIKAERSKKDDEINSLRQLKCALEEMSGAKDDKIKSLEEKIQKLKNRKN